MFYNNNINNNIGGILELITLESQGLQRFAEVPKMSFSEPQNVILVFPKCKL